MISIIVAGGSGTRLWPLSIKSKPKQFLHLNGNGRSLLQLTYDRVAKISDKVIVVTAEETAKLTRSDLPELPKEQLVLEPARKGTANAIYLGLRQLEKLGVSESEPIFWLWSDHLIRDQQQFEYTLAQAVRAVESGLSLVQFGIEPSSPSTALGYINKGQRYQEQQNIFELKGFKEKPDLETAKKFLKTGDYLWNAGYFVTTSGFMKTELKEVNPEASQTLDLLVDAEDSELAEIYSRLENKVIDYEFSERMRQAYVIACSFDWVDVGTFDDMHRVSDLDGDQNLNEGKNHLLSVHDSYIRNETDKDVAVIGLNNIVVVNTKDGLLVASKSHAQKVGILSKEIQK